MADATELGANHCVVSHLVSKRLDSKSVPFLAGRGVPLCTRRRIDVDYKHAPVAQLDRAAASGAVGREFESLRARHSLFLTLAKITGKGSCKPA